MMIAHPSFRIESFAPDEEQLKAYALAFREAHTRWSNYLGDPIFRSEEGFEEGAEDLREAMAKARPSRLVALLKKFETLPGKLYRVIENATGADEALPVYTGIRQISLEGKGAIIAEAFFGAEIHLLDTAGRILSRYHHEYAPSFGLGQLYLIDCNSLYDSQVKGRRDDPTAMEIAGYAPAHTERSITFWSRKGADYGVRHVGEEDPERMFKGTGGEMTVDALKNLGSYIIFEVLKRNKNGEPVHMDSRAAGYVGLEWKHIRDFTIQYNTFPFLNDRDQWVLTAHVMSAEDRRKTFTEKWQDRAFIQTHLERDPFTFQFMPPEIRGDKEWVEAFCQKQPLNYLFVEETLRKDRQLAIELISKAEEYRDSIYPYMPESMRKDLDILIVMKQAGRLFHLPDPGSVGYAKFDDIRNFVGYYRSRIDEVLELFPNALRYAPESMLADRQLVLRALPADSRLLESLPEHLQDDPDIIAAANNKYYPSLKYASVRLRKDPVFVLRMIEKCGQNIRYAPDKMKADRNVVLAAAHSGSQILDHVPEKFRDDEDIMLRMVKENGFALDKASDRLRRDKEFNLKAIGVGAYYRHNIHPSLLDDRDIVLKAMQRHPHEFEHIPERFKADREIVLTVVSRKGGYGNYIRHCPMELRDDPELIKAAVRDSEWNIRHASPRLLADRYFLAEILYDHPGAIRNLPDDMQFDPGLRELADRRRAELKAMSASGMPSETPPPPDPETENDEQDELPF